MSGSGNSGRGGWGAALDAEALDFKRDRGVGRHLAGAAALAVAKHGGDGDKVGAAVAQVRQSDFPAADDLARAGPDAEVVKVNAAAFLVKDRAVEQATDSAQ